MKFHPNNLKKFNFQESKPEWKNQIWGLKVTVYFSALYSSRIRNINRSSFSTPRPYRGERGLISRPGNANFSTRAEWEGHDLETVNSSCFLALSDLAFKFAGCGDNFHWKIVMVIASKMYGVFRKIKHNLPLYFWKFSTIFLFLNQFQETESLHSQHSVCMGYV